MTWTKAIIFVAKMWALIILLMVSVAAMVIFLPGWAIIGFVVVLTFFVNLLVAKETT